MLKEQMKKTENLRNDTHIVVEKLREEFDSLVREFSSYKKNTKEGNKAKQSKNYVQDLGSKNKQMDPDKQLPEGMQYHKRNEHISNEPDFLKRGNRDDNQDKKETNEKNNNQEKEGDKGNNPPFVPLLSLNKILS